MTLMTISRFLHSLAIAIWIGGMIYINLVLSPSLNAIDPPQRGRLLGSATKRFTILSWGSIVVLLITGVFQTPSGMLFDVSTAFGVALTIKHLVVLAMIVIGLLITFVVGPKMQSLAPPPGSRPEPPFLRVQNQLWTLARINMILGILVLLIAAML